MRQEDVRLVLKELDPTGVTVRRARRLRRHNYFSKGPNMIWHLDSYDKLKPYGICINGCIDGFSRKIIWLNAYTTSSDPKLIGSYYIEAVERLGGCPRVVRGDQRFLYINHADETLDSYLDGASTANRRMEYWWGFLRKEYIFYYIFGLLKNCFMSHRLDGNFHGVFWRDAMRALSSQEVKQILFITFLQWAMMSLCNGRSFSQREVVVER